MKTWNAPEVENLDAKMTATGDCPIEEVEEKVEDMFASLSKCAPNFNNPTCKPGKNS